MKTRPALLMTLLTMGMTLALAIGLTPATPTVAHAEAKLDHRPIVFVHGYNSGPGVWNGTKDRAKTYGYNENELFAFDYSKFTPGDTTILNIAAKLGAYIKDSKLTDKSPDGKIDIVAHSMGGLVSRAYLKQELGHKITSHLMTYGTPNHGTNLADWGCGTGVKCDGQTGEMQRNSTVLQYLNQDDETYGATKYATVRANVGDELIVNVAHAGTDLCDGMVFGETEKGDDAGNYAGRTSVINGAELNLVSSCLAHDGLRNDPWVVEKTLQWIADADGAHTPKAAQIVCGPLAEHWGKDKWVAAYAQSCVTATGAPKAKTKTVSTELQIRGCGYYYSIAATWWYAGRSDVECEVAYEGTLLRKGSQLAHTKSSRSENARTMGISTDGATASKGDTVSGAWTFGAHAYHDSKWDVKDATAETGTLTLS
ncbi:esterase/lipase family protein [Streptomyces jumonjinensis]|uniref:esterase/lipase family protein n=1 Tax=Streptomyces jumonjinensis TaxID=1945 RepID=UPI00379BAA8A